MAKSKRLLISVISALTLLLVGLALALFGPLPEERAFNKLSQTKIRFYWRGNSAREAFAKLNEELQKVSSTHYHFTIAESANDDTWIAMELDDQPATEVGVYLAALSDNQMYKSSGGIVIDRRDREALYDRPSWRRDLRGWVEYKLPWKLQRWVQQWHEPPESPVSQPQSEYSPGDDPFAPAPPK